MANPPAYYISNIAAANLRKIGRAGSLGCAVIACRACKGFGKAPKDWTVICGYCCGSARTPIPNEEVFPRLRTEYEPEDMLI